MALQNNYGSPFEDFGLPSYVLDRFNIGAPAAEPAPMFQPAPQPAPQAVTPAPVAPPTPAAPTTVEDLYRTILGREPEAEGLAYWQQGFGSTIDPAEVASFKQAAQVELDQRSAAGQQQLAPNPVNQPAPPAAVSDADVLGWFNANPGANDATIAQTMQQAGVTPEQVARATGANYQDVNTRYLAATQPAPVTRTPEQIQQDIVDQERQRQSEEYYWKMRNENKAGTEGSGTTAPANSSGIASLAPATPASVEDLYQQYLGRKAESTGATDYWKQKFGDTIDAQEAAQFKAAADAEIANRPNVVNDLYASIGRSGIGTDVSQIDQGGFDYWKNKLASGQSLEEVKQEFKNAVNDFLTNKKEDAYSQYVAPTYMKTVAADALANKDLTSWEQLNKIFETGQAYGLDDKKLDTTFGKDVADKYRAQYGAGIKDFITKTLAQDEGTTFNELAAIKNEARKYGLDPTEVAKYAGLNQTAVNTMFDSYDKGLANIAKGWDTAKTTAGTDTAAQAEAEANKVKTMLALQSQYNVTDEDLAKATGTTAKDVGTYLTAVKSAPEKIQSLVSDSKLTGADVKAKIEELKSNPAITGIYGAALDKISANADKQYSGEYGGQKFESMNPLAVSNVLAQLKAQQEAGTAQYYQGGAKEGKKGGFGSLDKLTEDMAKNLVAAGITDIRQVGQKTVTEADEEGNEVKRNIIINKATGEPISKVSNYSERTVGNAWSGTFAGPGNTGYNVQFDKSGNPIFYTTGASSNNMQDFAPMLALASFIPGAAPFVAAINAAYAAQQGNTKGALLSALSAAGPLAGMAGVNPDTVANINTASKLANVANAISNKDLLGTIMSGVGAASDANLMGENAFNTSSKVLGDFSTKDLLGGVSLANALKTGDLATLANVGAQMSGSQDAITAAKGFTLLNALKSNNPMAMLSAVQKMNTTQNVLGKAGGGLASLPGLIKNGNKNTLTDKTAFDGLNGNLVAKMLNQQPPAIRAAMLKKMTQTA